MEIYTKAELDEILKLHKLWLEDNGKGARANLSLANLRWANLSSAKTDKRYIQIACIGSRKDITTYCFEDDKITCGCFSGTLAEFQAKVKATHKDNKQYLAEYKGFIEYLKPLK